MTILSNLIGRTAIAVRAGRAQVHGARDTRPLFLPRPQVKEGKGSQTPDYCFSTLRENLGEEVDYDNYYY